MNAVTAIRPAQRTTHGMAYELLHARMARKSAYDALSGDPTEEQDALIDQIEERIDVLEADLRDRVEAETGVSLAVLMEAML